MWGYKKEICQTCGTKTELFTYRAIPGTTIKLCNSCWSVCSDYSYQNGKTPRSLRHVRHLVRKRIGWGHGPKTVQPIARRLYP
jgi:ribosome-binding protein aMBF1 (putative translation factor)